uniref:uncharacterized protein LOC122588344 n=1 Tax=Erigeron canadensis TaxID=72917 RepID=UPI001CB9D6FD|nr:uncharacterized protein LOC122588344 [Erigeron canadensis]
MKFHSHRKPKNNEDDDDDRGKTLVTDSSGKDVSDLLSKEQIRCLALYQQDSPKLGERSSWKNYRPWRQERNHQSARLEKQLMALEERIDKQLKRFQAQYSRPLNPTPPKEVANLLMPKSTPPLELTTLSWLGDCRPSSILDLLSSLVKSSPGRPSALTHAGAMEKAISQLIHDLRIEEAVIDEEMAEIQANCILNLPFSLTVEKPSGLGIYQVHSELKKVHRLIVKAQNFRKSALETVIKKILCQSDAAGFLLAFCEIQETVHQFSRDYKLRKGPVCVSLSPGSEMVGVDSSNSISSFEMD